MYNICIYRHTHIIMKREKKTNCMCSGFCFTYVPPLYSLHTYIHFFILFCLDSFYGYMRLTHFFGHSFMSVNINIWRCCWTVKPGISVFFPTWRKKIVGKKKTFIVIIIYKTNLSIIMSTSFLNLLKKFLVFFIICFLGNWFLFRL